MQSPLVLVPLLLSLSALGCGPYFTLQDHSTRLLASTARCTQGPLEVRVEGLGARWGEAIAISAQTPRRITGRWTVDLGKGKTYTGRYGEGVYFVNDNAYPGHTSFVHGDSDQPDNSRCVALATEQTIHQPAPETPAVTTPAARPRQRTAPRHKEAPVPEVAEVAPAPSAPGFIELPPEQPGGGLNIEIMSASWSNNDPEGPPPLAAGRPIIVRLWSVEPNDLEGVRFRLIHQIYRPSVTDDEYVRDYRRREAEKRVAAEREQARARAEREKEYHRAEVHTFHCMTHPQARDCQPEPPPRREGPGPAVVAQRTAPQPVQQPAREPVREPAHEPDRPPPAARRDPAPPQPSAHAEWVPGYWRWNGFDYGWIAGWWRVPESDIAARLTVSAPVPPPAPQAEQPPQPPAPMAVWTGGYWQWSGGAYIWVPGSWQLPPSGVRTWRQASWSREGPRVRFVPGGWIRLGP